VDAVNAFDRLARHIGSNAEFVDYVNPFDDQDLLIELYIAGHVGAQLLNADLACSQRAGKRARESPACGSDDVVERGGVFWEFAGNDPVVFGNRSVQSEADGLLLSGEPGQPDRPALSFDVNVRSIDRLAHRITGGIISS
jgi:hypothetical protein